MRRMITELDLEQKQNKLIAGEGIIIDGDTIKAVVNKLDVFDVLPLVEGSDTVTVDLNEANDKIGFKLDEQYKATLATKTDLAKKQDSLSLTDLDNIADINQMKKDIKDKQNKLIAGQNIEINPYTNVISATGSGTGDVTKEYLESQLKLKQDKLTITQLANISEVPFKADAKDLENYATKTELTEGLAGKQPTGEYATKSEVQFLDDIKQNNLTQEQLDNIAAVPSKADYIDMQQRPTYGYLNEQLATKQDVGDYVLKSELEAANYINTTEIWTFKLKDGSTVTKNVGVVPPAPEVTA